MNSRTVANIKYIDPSELFSWMKDGVATPFQVVDVRGPDYVGGHIKGGWNYPFEEFQEKLPELMKRLNDEREETGSTLLNVIFHCAQSLERGPTAAMKFLKTLPEDDLDHFKIYVLRGGFIHWQRLYGKDNTVTEDYRPDLWS